MELITKLSGLPKAIKPTIRVMVSSVLKLSHGNEFVSFNEIWPGSQSR